MKYEIVTVLYEGWFYFCPVWFEDVGAEESPMCPIPKYNLWLLLEAALMFQQAVNWVMSLFGGDEFTGFVASIKELKEPRQIRVRL